MVDIVIGIPSYQESKTIALVTSTIDQGLVEHYPDLQTIIVNADNASGDGTAEAFMATKTVTTKESINTGSSPRGKGVNIFAIMKYAQKAEAQALLLMDADLRSAERDWVPTLLKPVLSDDADLVTPLYARNRLEGNTTNHVAYPFLYAVYGKVVRQPIAGDFALSRKLIERLLSSPFWSSTEAYGIDIFITANAIRHSCRIAQKKLSRKIHNPGFPHIRIIPPQVFDTLFNIFLLDQKQILPAGRESSLDLEANSVDSAISIPRDDLVAEVRQAAYDYVRNNRQCLEKNFAPLRSGRLKRNIEKTLDSDLWTELLACAFTKLHNENVALLSEALSHLYLFRVFTYWNEIKPLSVMSIDILLDKQAEKLRRRLVQLAAKRNYA